MTEKNIEKGIRYFLIAIIYNLLISTIAYVVDWINDTFFQFSYATWDFIEWWMFASVIIIIGGFMLYLAPFFEQWLHVKLQNKIKKTLKGFSDNDT